MTYGALDGVALACMLFACDGRMSARHVAMYSSLAYVGTTDDMN